MASHIPVCSTTIEWKTETCAAPPDRSPAYLGFPSGLRLGNRDMRGFAAVQYRVRLCSHHERGKHGKQEALSTHRIDGIGCSDGSGWMRRIAAGRKLEQRPGKLRREQRSGRSIQQRSRTCREQRSRTCRQQRSRTCCQQRRLHRRRCRSGSCSRTRRGQPGRCH